MKRVLTKGEAISILKPGETVHCLMNPSVNVLVGADWDRKSVIEAIEKGAAELAGKQAMAMGHGLCIDQNKFFETVENPESLLEKKP